VPHVLGLTLTDPEMRELGTLDHPLRRGDRRRRRYPAARYITTSGSTSLCRSTPLVVTTCGSPWTANRVIGTPSPSRSSCVLDASSRRSRTCVRIASERARSTPDSPSTPRSIEPLARRGRTRPSGPAADRDAPRGRVDLQGRRFHARCPSSRRLDGGVRPFTRRSGASCRSIRADQLSCRPVPSPPGRLRDNEPYAASRSCCAGRVENRESPLLPRVSIDAQPPLEVAAGRERHADEVEHERPGNRRAGPEPGRTPHLERVAQDKRRAAILAAPGSTITFPVEVDQLNLEGVPLVGPLPRTQIVLNTANVEGPGRLHSSRSRADGRRGSLGWLEARAGKAATQILSLPPDRSSPAVLSVLRVVARWAQMTERGGSRRF
jgi:hypothetical protein